MRYSLTLLIALIAPSAFAVLPPPTAAEKATAAEAAARDAWENKVGAYQLCKAQDRVAAKYRARNESAGKPEATPACHDPGPYHPPVATAEPEPLEASESHSPAGMSVQPPSTRAKEAETQGKQGH
jgi:hypothetical protein